MATTFTPIYAFDLPADGDTGWGSLRNQNMTDTDQELARQRIPFLSPTVGGTTTLDLSQTTGARVFVFTVSQVSALAFSNVPTSSFYARWWAIITNGGAFALSYPAAVTWLSGAAPTLQTSGVDVLEFFTKDGGTTVYARHLNGGFQRVGSAAATGREPVLAFKDFSKSTTSVSDVSLSSTTIKGSSLVSDGDILLVTLMLRAVTQNASFNVKFGATASTALAITAGTQTIVQAILLRTGAATQRLGLGTLTQVAAAETLANDITLDFRGSVTSGGTLTLDSVTVQRLGA